MSCLDLIPSFRLIFVIGGTTLAMLVGPAFGQTPEALDYTEEIRPLLARNCFACHGPDEESREADLRLDAREYAVDSAIDESDLPNSALLERIVSADPDLKMPPPSSGKSLSTEQIEKLTRWVKAGAKYQQHWAFVPPRMPNVPDVGEAYSSWKSNAIDAFLLRKMTQVGLMPSPPADRQTLVRRLYIDLVGLLPTPEEADAFVRDQSPDAYENLVARLLASRHYGERWAMPWLDVARYSDTNGYEKDRPRSIWPYRDWVIESLNKDMPFDQFTIEQLAGDMLPNPTLSQRIATGFHRNTMLNEEGGIDPLEYRFYAMVDRVATTGTAWMGLTIGCAQCHAHKYDPVSHEDYYRFMALLNNANEPDLVTQKASSADRANVQQQIGELLQDLGGRYEAGTSPGQRQAAFGKAFSTWVRDTRESLADWQVVKPVRFEAGDRAQKLERMADNSLFARGDFTKRDSFHIVGKLPTSRADSSKTKPITAIRLEVLPDERLPNGGPGRAYYEGRMGDFFLSEIEIQRESAKGELIPISFRTASASFGKIAIGSGSADASNIFDGEGSTGWSTATREGERHSLVLIPNEPFDADRIDIRMLFERHFVAALGRFRFSVSSGHSSSIRAVDITEDVEAILLRDEATWSRDDRHALYLAFTQVDPRLAAVRKEIEQLKRPLQASTTTLVMSERAADNPRVTWRHHRGEWLNKREVVAGGVPTVFPALPPNEPANRLTLARWLVSERNPLVARVVVNRAWRELMGDALVRSDGDFGTQSEPPTHPQLLDWLACQFMENGWSLKSLHRQIVLSSAYRQQSIQTKAHRDLDPENRFFARGPRHRVTGETIRDLLLDGCGLLSRKIGGPSVRPPQPASVTALAYGSTKWPASTGPDRFRRSLYTFRKRTAPFAAFTTFDAPSGENCVIRRNRSNTPLQSLTLLNDAMYFEMAQSLGTRAAQIDGSIEQKIAYMFRRLLTRSPSGEELQRLSAYFDQQAGRLADGDLDSNEVIGNPATGTNTAKHATDGAKASDEAIEQTNESATAALVLVARVLMNLDEVITKQ